MPHRALHLPSSRLRWIGVDASSDRSARAKTGVGSVSNGRRGVRRRGAALRDYCLADIPVAFEDFLCRYICAAVE